MGFEKAAINIATCKEPPSFGGVATIRDLYLKYYEPDADIVSVCNRDTYWLSGIIRLKENSGLTWLGYDAWDFGFGRVSYNEIMDISKITDFDISGSLYMTSGKGFPKGTYFADNGQWIRDWVADSVQAYHNEVTIERAPLAFFDKKTDEPI